MRCSLRGAACRGGTGRRARPAHSVGLLSRRGAPPHATYLFKHALVQDAAYGTLLREPSRALHARIASALESQFPDIAESQPELLARHCAEAGLIEKAARLWGKAGLWSLARSAIVEAEAQLTRALEIAACRAPRASPRADRASGRACEDARCRPGATRPGNQSAPSSKRAFYCARRRGRASRGPGCVVFGPLRILGEPCGVRRELRAGVAEQCLSLAQKHRGDVPLVIAHGLLGTALVVSGDFLEGQGHLDRADALYDPEGHSRPLLTKFGLGFALFLTFRCYARWALGRPEAARVDVERALGDARKIGHGITLMAALHLTGDDISSAWERSPRRKAQADELVALAEEKSTLALLAHGMADQSCVLALSGETSKAVQSFERAIAYDRSLASTVEIPSRRPFWRRFTRTSDNSTMPGAASAKP